MSDIVDNSKEEAKYKKLDKKRERELSDIRRVIQLPEGRRLYWRLMEKGGAFKDAYCGEYTNGTNYNLGRQSISRDFLNDLLEAKPEALTQMQQERDAQDESDRLQEAIDLKTDGGLT